MNNNILLGKTSYGNLNTKHQKFILTDSIKQFLNQLKNRGQMIAKQLDEVIGVQVKK